MPIIGDAPIPPLPLTELTGPSTWRIAKTIFQEKETSKNNFFGIDDWTEHFHEWGVRFDENVLRQAEEFPWDEQVLRSADPQEKDREIRETHFAFLGLARAGGEPFTLRFMLEKLWGEAFENLWRTSWFYHAEFIMKTTCKPQWYLMRIKPINGSPLWSQDKIDVLYDRAFVIEEFTKNLLIKTRTGQWSNAAMQALCEEKHAGEVIFVGGNDMRTIHSRASVAHLETLRGITGMTRYGYSGKMRTTLKECVDRDTDPAGGITMYS
jgi:hypothetical protein